MAKKRSDISMNSIAELAGVSKMTVSRVLNGTGRVAEETKKKIKKIAERIGYFPNELGKSLLSNRTKNIGIVIPDISFSFFPTVVGFIERELTKAGYNTFLCCSYNDTEIEAHKVFSLLSHRVSGIIIVPSLRSDQSKETARMIQRQNCPLVIMDRSLPGLEANEVTWDSFPAMVRIAKAVIKRGCRNVVYLSGPRAEWRNRNRTRALLQTMQEHNLPVRIVECEGDLQAVTEALRPLFQKKSAPDAICCINDTVAEKVIEALDILKVENADNLCITGFSGCISNAILKRPIITAFQDPKALGSAAAQMLLAQIERPARAVRRKKIKVRMQP